MCCSHVLALSHDRLHERPFHFPLDRHKNRGVIITASKPTNKHTHVIANYMDNLRKRKRLEGVIN
jgi:hypothetical protein